MAFSIDTKVGDLAAKHPLSTRVFARHDIDFCCGGGRPLRAVCEEQGLEPDELLEEIRAEVEGESAAKTDWTEAPLDEVIEHIVEAFHRPLREELPRLEAMAKKVNRVHGDKRPEMLSGIVETFHGLKAELESHMMKEEQVLFPMIRAGRGGMARGPVSAMEHEHDSAAKALETLRSLTNDYEVPGEACTTWRALWHGLEALEEEMHQHIHLENNILFPRALRS